MSQPSRSVGSGATTPSAGTWQDDIPLRDSPATRRLDRTKLALVLLDYGCRRSNVELVTELPHLMLLSAEHGHEQPPGRLPESEAMVLQRRVVWGVAASFTVAAFDDYRRSQCCSPGWALALAWRDYTLRFREWTNESPQLRRKTPSLKFNINHLMLLAGRTFGLWGHERRLALHECPNCRSRYLADHGVSQPANLNGAAMDGGGSVCHFCQMAARYHVDSRVRIPVTQISRVAQPAPEVAPLLATIDQLPRVHGAGISAPVRPTFSFQS